MDESSAVAEQIMRIGLQGTEMAVRITGIGAKNLAVLIHSILQENTKTAGKTRLAAMLKSEKELSVFTVKNSDLKTFAKEAKRYGVLYCALREKNPLEEGMVDIMVREEDSAKINRIVERFKFASVDVASVTAEIENDRKDKVQEASEPENPSQANPQWFPLSETISKARETSGRESSEASRKSIRKKMDEIRREYGQRDKPSPINDKNRANKAASLRAPKAPVKKKEGRHR